MKRYTIYAGLLLALAGTTLLAGCDREVAHTKKVDIKNDGTVKTQEKTVTQNADGSTTIKDEKSTSHP